MSRRPSWTDAALTGAVCAGLVLDIAFTSARHGPLAANVVAAVALGAPLAWRRIAPLAAIALSASSGR